ncbi:hypothetical protein [Psychroserpens sp. S379A]|uniref:hypothetical protein n=1 Tax=Psychroserpens sp. S379A TaxID=3415137 RepID=UPI003C7BC817
MLLELASKLDNHSLSGKPAESLNHLANQCRLLAYNIKCGQFDEGIIKDAYVSIVRQALEITLQIPNPVV